MGYPITASKRLFEDIEWKLKNKCVYALQSCNLLKFQLPAIFLEGQLEGFCDKRSLNTRGIQESTPYNGLNGKAPSERGTFLRFQVYERVGIACAQTL